MKRPWNGSKWIRRTTRLAIYIRDEFTCQYCGRNLKDLHPRVVTLDHVLPVALGGKNAANNLVMACRPCNIAKDDQYLADFAGGFDTPMFERVHTQLALPLNRTLARSILRSGRKKVTTCAS